MTPGLPRGARRQTVSAWIVVEQRAPPQYRGGHAVASYQLSRSPSQGMRDGNVLAHSEVDERCSARALAVMFGGDIIMYANILRRDSPGHRARVMHSKRRYGIVILIWCATAASPAYAQRGAGVIHDTGSDAPLAGAVVTTLDSIRQPTGRVLPDAAGRYSLELP